MKLLKVKNCINKKYDYYYLADIFSKEYQPITSDQLNDYLDYECEEYTFERNYGDDVIANLKVLDVITPKVFGYCKACFKKIVVDYKLDLPELCEDCQKSLKK